MATQEEIPEVMRRVPEIESAAASYVSLRDMRMKLTKQEVDARTILIESMKAAKVETYTTVEEMVCILTSTEKVKVKATPEDEEESE